MTWGCCNNLEWRRHQVQVRRFKGTRLLTNADMGPAEVREFCRLDEAGQRLMQAAMRQLHLSARAYHRVLKLARTIADLAEAIQYRPRWVECFSSSRERAVGFHA